MATDAEVMVNINPCLGPMKEIGSPALRAPAGTWDTHFHVFGPTDRFPYARKRKYTPPDSPLEDYLVLMERLGIERAVCVHPNLHGPDNTVTLDAIRRSDGRILGIAKIDDNATRASVKALHAAGMRGIRFAFNPQHGGELDEGLFSKACDWAGELGWCIELHMASEDIPEMAEKLSRLSVPVVIDHFARINPSKGVQHPEFSALLELMKYGHIWTKVTGADRISRLGAPYADVVPFARLLIEVAPDRILWGTDWPHSGYFDPGKVPDDARLLDVLLDYCPDEGLRRQILVENPHRLFDKPPAGTSMGLSPIWTS